MQFLMTMKEKMYETIAKGEIADTQHFVLNLKCFLLFSNQILLIVSHWFCCLQMLLIVTTYCKIVLLDTELSSRAPIE